MTKKVDAGSSDMHREQRPRLIRNVDDGKRLELGLSLIMVYLERREPSGIPDVSIELGRTGD